MDRSMRDGALLGILAGAVLGLIIGFVGLGLEFSVLFTGFGLASALCGALIGGSYGYFRGR